MKSGKLGIAVIGSGRAGLIHARNFASGIDGAKLVAMVDPFADALDSALVELGIERGYHDYRDAMADPDIDAVIVVTPTVYHKDIVLAAARAGRHVLCEKPMAMDADECRIMNEACAKAGVKLQIGFMRRFDRNFRKAWEAVDQGRVGDVVLVKSLTRGPSVPQAWMYDIAKSNGPLAEVNSHDIDAVRWFAGSDITEVYAIAGNYRCPEAREKYPDFYDNVVMNARLANGMQGCIDGAVSVGYGYDARLEVLGTKGVLFVGGLADSSVVVCSTGADIVSPAVRSWRNLFIDAYRGEDISFVECIRKDTEPEVTGLDGLEAVRVVNAGNRSIVEKRPVRLD
jgi:myo-inositol 2-dehydrogenase/D-chiro-inositol 1-dehydrogenase/scyllo-inositol 2-dehydrogenase (NAD+)